MSRDRDPRREAAAGSPARGPRRARHDDELPGRARHDGELPRRPRHDDELPGLPLPAATILWLPVTVSLFIQVSVVLWQLQLFEIPRRGGAGIALLLAVAGPLALLASRRFPGPVAAIAASAAVVDLLVYPTLNSPYLALAFAVVFAIVRDARGWAYASVAGAWLTAVIGASLLDVRWHPIRIALTTLGLLAVIALAEAVRGRRARFAQLRQRESRRRLEAAQAERVRIARELHDVLAHSLSQINVQAGVGLHLIESQPELAAETLASIKATSKTALDEVRAVLGVLRDDAGDPEPPRLPEPDLARLPGLIASMSSPDLVITMDNRITSVPSAAVQLALYRIVQESLTNVVRHAGAGRATVELVETGDDYTVRVWDDGGGAAATDGAPVPGRGLLGMKERAGLLGGTLTTSTPDGGGFRVTATIRRSDPGQAS